MSTFTLAISFDHFQFALIHGPNIPGSYGTLLFPASDFASITSHIHYWELFLLWLHLFIVSRVISPLFSSRILGTYSLDSLYFSVIFFAFSYSSWGFQGKNTKVVFHYLLQRTMFFSELSTMTHPSWVALHGMAHSFIELDKATVHVISLISFL